MKSKYFTEYEMLQSLTAKKYGIDNTPTEEIREHLYELMLVLDTIREGWMSPIRVTSGYRCKALNTAVGGSKTSVHMLGYAADIYPYNNQFNKFVEYLKKWAETHEFDQLLIEQNSKGGRWIHIGFKNNKGEQRHQIKNLKVV